MDNKYYLLCLDYNDEWDRSCYLWYETFENIRDTFISDIEDILDEDLLETEEIKNFLKQLKSSDVPEDLDEIEDAEINTDDIDQTILNIQNWYFYMLYNYRHIRYSFWKYPNLSLDNDNY